MFDQLCDGGRWVIDHAREEARRRGHTRVEPEHLLLGMLAVEKGTAACALVMLGVQKDWLQRYVDGIDARGDETDLAYSPQTLQVFDLTLEEAERLEHAHIDNEHLLLGVAALHERQPLHVLLALELPSELIRDQVGAINMLDRRGRSKRLDSCDDEPLGLSVVCYAMALLAAFTCGLYIGWREPGSLRALLLILVASVGALPLALLAARRRATHDPQIATMRAVERLAVRGRQVIARARLAAWSRQHQTVTARHLLLGLLEVPGGRAAAALAVLGGSLTTARQACDSPAEPRRVRTPADLPMSDAVRRAVDWAERSARGEGERAGTACLLRGIARQRDTEVTAAFEAIGLADPDRASAVDEALGMPSETGSRVGCALLILLGLWQLGTLATALGAGVSPQSWGPLAATLAVGLTWCAARAGRWRASGVTVHLQPVDLLVLPLLLLAGSAVAARLFGAGALGVGAALVVGLSGLLLLWLPWLRGAGALLDDELRAAQQLRADGDLEGARTLMREALASRVTPLRQLELAILEGRLGRWAEALPLLEAARPRLSGPWRALGETQRGAALLALGRTDEALAAVEPHLCRPGTAFAARCVKARALAALGNHPEARAVRASAEPLARDEESLRALALVDAALADGP